MYDFLIDENRALSEEESSYRNIFLTLMNTLCYILMVGEKFAQCIRYYENDKDNRYRFYCPYWFVSNYGYIISVYGNKIKVLAPQLKIGGERKRDKYKKIVDASEYYPDYVRNTTKNWEKKAQSGQTPQYYFYTNVYPKTAKLGKGKKYNVVMHQIQAFYFCKDGGLILDDDYVIHHKIFKDFSKAPQLTNSSCALQVLLNLDGGFSTSKHPELKQHYFIHYVDKATSKEKMDNLFTEAIEKVESGELPTIIFTSQKAIEDFILSGINPDSPIAFSGKDEEGKTIENAYFKGKDLKTI